MASGLPPVSFREVNGRQKALVTSVMTRCETLKVGLLKELEEFRQDESADRDKFLEIGIESLEEFGETVDKLHSMYDLERFIGEQERLQKRVPELEEEIRRLKPREDQLLEQAKTNEKKISDLQASLESAVEEHGTCNNTIEALNLRLTSLQDEIEKLKSKVTVQAKTLVKANEAFLSLQDQHTRLEEQLSERKIEYEANLRDSQERHEQVVDELKEAAAKASDDFTKLISDCNRKLEKVERQGLQELKRREDTNTDLERKLSEIMEQHEPAQDTISTQKMRLAQLAEEMERVLASMLKQRQEETRLNSRVTAFEAQASTHRKQAQEVHKELNTTLEELHAKRLYVCALELEMQDLRAESTKLKENTRTVAHTHSEEVAGLTHELQQRERDVAALREDVAEGVRKAHELQTDMDEANARYTQMHENALLQQTTHKTQIQSLTEEIAAETKSNGALLVENTAVKKLCSVATGHLEAARKALLESKAQTSEALQQLSDEKRQGLAAVAATDELRADLTAASEALQNALAQHATETSALGEQIEQKNTMYRDIEERLDELLRIKQGKDKELISMGQKLASAETVLKKDHDEHAAELAKGKMKEEVLQRTTSDLQFQTDKNFATLKKKFDDASSKVEMLKGDIKMLKAAEKDKDKQVDDAWKKMRYLCACACTCAWVGAECQSVTEYHYALHSHARTHSHPPTYTVSMWVYVLVCVCVCVVYVGE